MSQGSTTPSLGPPSQATLLVVEDDPTINQAVTDRLVAEGFRVIQAYDGPGAVAAHAESGPTSLCSTSCSPASTGSRCAAASRRSARCPCSCSRPAPTRPTCSSASGSAPTTTSPSRSACVRSWRASVRCCAGWSGRARSPRSSRPCSTLGALERRPGARAGSRVGASEVHLTPLEFDLLLALAAEPGAVRGRDELMREVWGWADARGTRTLDSHVKALRAKIGPDRVRTVHGVGYALEASARAPTDSDRARSTASARSRPSSACSSAASIVAAALVAEIGDRAGVPSGSPCR